VFINKNQSKLLQEFLNRYMSQKEREIFYEIIEGIEIEKEEINLNPKRFHKIKY
jgi:hypothetical protein